ncbi:MAG TPA: DNA-processing protein DprA [Solirubrobacteraceae bacterium]|nr:DNA-processing protein DprA [Solirubrobacteraceae bacterium]
MSPHRTAADGAFPAVAAAAVEATRGGPTSAFPGGALEDPRRDACPACLRRAWLLATLSARLAYRARDPEGLLQALALSDQELIRALGGRHKRELFERHARFERSQLPAAEGVRRICHHDPLYHPALRGAGAPPMLHVAGGFERMHALLAQPTVAIVGTRRASDYGMEVAYGLARGMAASGITVVSGLAEGIAAAAHQGALPTGGRTVTVMAGGVDVANPASWRGLHRRIAAEGCALAELPCGAIARGWCHIARARIVTALARVVIVVEAHERPAELLHARLAAATGATIAAVPGRVSAPGARGPHQLLREGALLVREPQDVLDALYGVGVHRAAVSRPAPGGRLRAVLDQVGAGNDTVAKLTAGAALQGAPAHEVLVALAELELGGAVARGDGGRYVVCM